MSYYLADLEHAAGEVDTLAKNLLPGDTLLLFCHEDSQIPSLTLPLLDTVTRRGASVKAIRCEADAVNTQIATCLGAAIARDFTTGNAAPNDYSVLSSNLSPSLSDFWKGFGVSVQIRNAEPTEKPSETATATDKKPEKPAKKPGKARKKNKKAKKPAIVIDPNDPRIRPRTECLEVYRSGLKALGTDDDKIDIVADAMLDSVHLTPKGRCVHFCALLTKNIPAPYAMEMYHLTRDLMIRMSENGPIPGPETA